MDSLSVISCAAAFLVAVIAFAYGAVRLLPMHTLAYFHFLIWGVACFALLCLSACVSSLCNIVYEPYVSLGSFGIVGVYIAFLCANFGVLDKTVDERTPDTRKARYLAFAAPSAGTALIVRLCAEYFSEGRTASGILLILLSIPMLFSCYLNVKHLMLPVDAMGILKATRGCNGMCLLFVLIEIFYMYAVAFDAVLFMNLFFFLHSVVLLLLMYFAVKGAEKWSL